MIKLLDKYLSKWIYTPSMPSSLLDINHLPQKMLPDDEVKTSHNKEDSPVQH